MFAGNPSIFSIDPYSTDTYQMHQLGAKGVDKYGDIYRYAKVGASAITSGKLSTAPARKTNHDNCALSAAAAVGATSVSVTLGATAATANEYAGGYLVFSDVAPEGVAYRIIKHAAIDSSGTGTFYLERGLVEAATTSSEVCLVHNTWNAVIEQAVEEAEPAGIPQVDMAAGTFGWLKTHGVTAALAGANITLGANVVSHSSTAGAVMDNADVTTVQTEYVVGKALVAGVSGEYRPIMLYID